MLNDAVGIDKGFMTTVHSYTNDQPTLDQVHKDLYRARAAALNMIPTSTGAAKAVGLVLPELAGRLDGVAIRVPTPNVSVIDFKFVAKRATSKEEINAAVKRAAEQQLKGILGYTDAPNVSTDFNHDPRSSVFHMDQTKSDGRHAGAGDVLVRQRVGLLQPHAGYRGGGRPAGLSFPAMSFRSLDDADVKGRRVLVRVDLNVPMQDGKVTDATRIEEIVPTVLELAGKGGKVILLSHFGRPKGPNAKDSLRPVAAELARILQKPVAFAEDCVGPKAETAIAAMSDGDILCLENTRFHPEEEKNDPAFAKKLASLGDIFVNEAFSVAHRAHAANVGIVTVSGLPAYPGRAMAAELESLAKAFDTPQRPVAAIVGGAKVSTKLDLLGHLLSKVDTLIIGGGMANTFLAAQGLPVGKSLCENDLIPTAREIMAKAKSLGREIVLPVDVVVAEKFAAYRAIPRRRG